jgi:hypothetical protein
MALLSLFFYTRFGERFPALNNAYTKDLQKLAKDIGKELNFGSFLREGVYACVGGPVFETTAEVHYLQKVYSLCTLQQNSLSRQTTSTCKLLWQTCNGGGG